MIYISCGGEFIKRDGEIELIPADAVHAWSVRISRPYFLFGALTAGICARKYFPIALRSLFPSVKSTPSDFFSPPSPLGIMSCENATCWCESFRDVIGSRLRAYLFPRLSPPRRSVSRSVREPNGERRMGNDRLRPCSGQNECWWASITFYRYNLPAKFQTGGCMLALRRVAMY